MCFALSEIASGKPTVNSELILHKINTDMASNTNNANTVEYIWQTQIYTMLILTFLVVLTIEKTLGLATPKGLFTLESLMFCNNILFLSRFGER